MMSPGIAVPPDPRAYVRIAGMLREMISSRVLPPGSPAPSITRLCREHGHARQTCGRAMRLLVLFTDRQRVRLVAELRR